MCKEMTGIAGGEMTGDEVTGGMRIGRQLNRSNYGGKNHSV